MQYLYRNLINVRRLAVHNRLDDSIESYIEKAYRYYSKTYGLPLHQAKAELSKEEVCLVFMEDEMEDWTPDEILKVRQLLSNSEVPIVEAALPQAPGDDEISDDQWIAEQNKILKAEEKRKQQEEIAKKTHEVIENLTQSFNSVAKNLNDSKDTKT